VLEFTVPFCGKARNYSRGGFGKNSGGDFCDFFSKTLAN